MTDLPDAAEAPGARPQVLIDGGRFAEARTLLRAELARHPDDAELWCLLALCEIKTDRLDDGLHAATTAMTLNPDDEWAYRLLSLAHSERNERRPALDAARESVRRGPDLWQTHTRLAMALSELRWHDDAHAHALHAVELAPDQPSTHFALGIVAYAHGEYATAERAYTRTLELDPAHAAAMNNLGLLQLRRGRVRRAAEQFTSSLRSDPRLDVARHNVELVGWRLLSVAYWLALAGSLVLRPLLDPTGPGPYGARVTVGCVLLAGWALLLVRMVRPLPTTAKRYVLALPRRDTGFGVLTVGVGACVTGTLLAAFAPVAVATVGLYVTLGGLVLGMVTWWAVRVRQRSADG